MHYIISFKHPLTHFLDICLRVNTEKTSITKLLLPVWRPGRYELHNYAKNIRNVRIADAQKHSLNFRKVSKNSWQVNTRNTSEIHVYYQYYAFKLDAGGSLLDDQQLYLNFINCLLFVKNRLAEPCTVELKLGNQYKIACGLPRIASGQLLAKDYYQLVDSPLIASPLLKHWKFRLEGVAFHLWFMGSNNLIKSNTIKAFKKFIGEQIKTMGGFPESAYHFLYQIPEMKIYHGVEHRNSTVIALGPGSDLHKSRYIDFLGVSSHEFFHCWNVIKIRPKELYPYNFEKETYFDTGFIAEGVTTYYGDLFLIRSGVFSIQQYFKELNKLLKRHFENDGRHYSSLVESSRDLWVDGYQQGAPDKKVSIYTKGALVSLMLDLKIRMETDQKASLDHVMRYLWKEFGKKTKGYTLKDFQKICESISKNSFKDYFQNFVHGTTPVDQELSTLLHTVGCSIKTLPSKRLTKKLYGFKTTTEDHFLTVSHIAADSPAFNRLSLGDKIIKINGKKPKGSINRLFKDGKANLLIDRMGRRINLLLDPDGESYYNQLRVVQLKRPSDIQASNFCLWLGQKSFKSSKRRS